MFSENTIFIFHSKVANHKMKTFLTTIVITFFATLHIAFAVPADSTISNGQQPQITIDNLGTIRIIYGSQDKIYCATSVDNGLTFPSVQLVGEIKDMHLGMSRGPQVASSKNYTLVAAIDKKGMIHIFQLNHQSGKWTKQSFANDLAGSAPEGLISIAADENDIFYAVWLDTRYDKRNKICFAKTTDHGESWQKNKIVYQSPDKTVCECCKPGIAVSKSNVFIMFRNWLNGSRDLYLLQSENKGSTFTNPVKLGYGTWKLNGCPMDGGGLTVSKKRLVAAVWQREGHIYFSKPAEMETQIGTGRNCSITDAENPIITWQEGKKLHVKEVNKAEIYNAGEGSFIKAIRTKNNKIFCA
jgi:hypothetical protein